MGELHVHPDELAPFYDIPIVRNPGPYACGAAVLCMFGMHRGVALDLAASTQSLSITATMGATAAAMKRELARAGVHSSVHPYTTLDEALALLAHGPIITLANFH